VREIIQVAAFSYKLILLPYLILIYKMLISILLWLSTLNMMYVLVAITINFTQSTYLIDENDEMIQLGLVFSNPSSFDITVDIRTMDINATGK